MPPLFELMAEIAFPVNESLTVRAALYGCTVWLYCMVVLYCTVRLQLPTRRSGRRYMYFRAVPSR